MATASDKWTYTITTTDREGNKIRVKVASRPEELRKLKELKTSPVGKFIYKNGIRVSKQAKNMAPVSPRGSHGRPAGFLKRRIGVYLGQDSNGPYADVTTRAKSKASKSKTWAFNVEDDPAGKLTKSGRPRKKRVATSRAAYYGRIQNQRTHYLERALRSLGG